METPAQQLLNSAKRTKDKLAAELNNVKSLPPNSPEFEAAFKRLEEADHETIRMLQRLSISIKAHSES